MSKQRVWVFGILLACMATASAQTNVAILSLNPGGVLSFGEVSNAAGYRIVWSTNLALASWTNASAPGVSGIAASPGAGTRSATVGIAQAANFFRLMAMVTNPPVNRPRGSYYVNFQGFGIGHPPSPVIVDGKTYLQAGWTSVHLPGTSPFYGWHGMPDAQHLSFYYSGTGTYSIVERSYLYDDYGRRNYFEFELEPGLYRVIVGVGKAGVGSLDPQNVTVEGQAIVNDEVLPNVVARTNDIQLVDGSLSFAVGGKSPSLNVNSITYIAYLKIEPIP